MDPHLMLYFDRIIRTTILIERLNECHVYYIFIKFQRKFKTITNLNEITVSI